MNTRIIFAAAVAIALSVPAFAQDNPQSAPAPATDQQGSSATQSATDGQPPAPRVNRHRMRTTGNTQYSPAAMALTGNDAKTAAYQASDRQKSFPAVDHGHVPGDPPVIDHSGDNVPVPDPTRTTITVPPGH